MDVVKVIKKLKNGGKFRCKHWRKGAYLVFDSKEGYLKVEYGIENKTPHILMLKEDFESNNWEEIKE